MGGVDNQLVTAFTSSKTLSVEQREPIELSGLFNTLINYKLNTYITYKWESPALSVIIFI